MVSGTTSPPVEEVEASALIVVGLGSNLGDRVAHLLQGIAGVVRVAKGEVRVSGLWESAAIGPEQPDYLNAAVAFRVADSFGVADSFSAAVPSQTAASLSSLLDELQRIEAEAGRERLERWGPRTLDLDILWAEETCMETPRLTVPHARLSERAFALLPLLELLPDSTDPISQRRFSAILEGLPPQRIRQFVDDRWIKTLSVEMGATRSGQR